MSWPTIKRLRAPRPDNFPEVGARASAKLHCPTFDRLSQERGFCKRVISKMIELRSDRTTRLNTRIEFSGSIHQREKNGIRDVFLRAHFRIPAIIALFFDVDVDHFLVVRSDRLVTV